MQFVDVLTYPEIYEVQKANGWVKYKQKQEINTLWIGACLLLLLNLQADLNSYYDELFKSVLLYYMHYLILGKRVL